MASLTLEGVVAGERLVKYAAKRIHVRSGVDEHSLELLGGHEENRAKNGLDFLQFFEGLRLGQRGEPEIDDFHLKFPGRKPSEHQVGGFDVAVDEIEFLGGDERFFRLQGELAEVCPSEGRAFDQFVESFATDEFHHHVWAVGVRADVVDGDDVRVLQRGEGPGLLDQLAGGFFLECGVASGDRDALDGDLAVHPRVIASINRAKSALADFSANFVAFFHGWEVAQNAKYRLAGQSRKVRGAVDGFGDMMG